MKLEEAKMKLPAYLRGALTREESAAVEQALSHEQLSNAELQRLEQVDGMLRATPAPEPPPGYFKDLAARIQSKVVGRTGEPGQERSMSSKNEDSGLLDVRALAANSLSAAQKDAPEQIPVSEYSQLSGRASVVGMQVAPLPPPEPAQMFAPTVMPQQVSSPSAPKWVWPLLGLVGVIAAGAIAVAVFAMKDKPAPAVVAVNEAAPESAPAAKKVEVTPLPPSAAPVVGDKPAAPAAAPAEQAKPAPVAEPAAAEEEAAAAAPTATVARGGKAAKGKPAKGGKAVALAAPAPAAKAPAPAAKESKADAKAAAVSKVLAQATAAPAAEEKPAPKQEKAKPAGRGAELDSLLASALTPGKARDDDDEAPKKKEAPKAEASKPAADPMKASLDGLKPRGKRCFAKFNIPGTVEVRLSVGANGAVQSVSLSGDYDGTPTGSCLLKELKTATFPAGSARSVSHSFKLP